MTPPQQTKSSAPPIQAPYSNDPRFGWRRLRLPALLMLIALICPVYGFWYALTTPYLLVQFTFPLMFLAAVAIWALPELERAPTNLLASLLFMFFIAMALWPNYLAIALPGLPWITMIRLIGFPLALTLLICASISAEFRKTTKESLSSIPLLMPAMIGFICAQFISLPFSDELMTSINKIIVSQISWAAIFFASAYVFLKPGRTERWSYVLWAMGLVLGIIAIRENGLGRLPWAGNIPKFLAVEDDAVQRMLAGASRSGVKYRSQAIYSTSLGLAEYMALLTPFICHFIVGPFKIFTRISACVSIIFIFYVIVLTDSRLGVVGFFVGTLLTLFFWGAMRWRQQKGSLFGPAVVFAYPAVFALVMASTVVFGRLRAMVWGGGQHQASNEARADQLHSGLPLIFKHPLGFGPGRGVDGLGYRNLAGTLTIDNYYLLIALDYGIMGFIFYYGMILLVIGHSSKNALNMKPTDRDQTFLVPIAIALTSFFIIKSIFSQTENHPIAFMMIGMAAALVFRMKQGNAQPASPRTD